MVQISHHTMKYNVLLILHYFAKEELRYEVAWSFSQVIVHELIIHEILYNYYVIYSKYIAY